MRTERSRVVAASPEAVFAVLADPWHLARWWPRTQRVEGVSDTGWTTVLTTERGRSIRADWALEASEPPTLRRWRQELEGTAFAALFTHHAVEVRVGPADEGARVSLAVEQKVRGWARLAPFLVKRAMRVQIEDALTGLASLVEDGA